jgi:hypothetical protein
MTAKSLKEILPEVLASIGSAKAVWKSKLETRSFWTSLYGNGDDECKHEGDKKQWWFFEIPNPRSRKLGVHKKLCKSCWEKETNKINFAAIKFGSIDENIHRKDPKGPSYDKYVRKVCEHCKQGLSLVKVEISPGQYEEPFSFYCPHCHKKNGYQEPITELNRNEELPF